MNAARIYRGRPSPARNRQAAIASLVLGVISLVAWRVPIGGVLITGAGLILGVKGLKSRRRGIAIAGTILSSIGLIAASVYAALDLYMVITGQNSLVGQAEGT